MLVERYLKNKSVIKRASPGEFVMGTLIPNRTYGWGGWGQVNRLEQVMHLKNWTYVAVDTIASSIGGITPNMAYVSDVAKPGVTTKAGYRGMMNARNKGFGGSFEISSGGHSFLTIGEYRSKALSVVKPHEELEPLENDHRLRELFDNPNPQDTAYDLLYELDMFLELCGVTYLWIIPSATGEIAEMWVIPAHWVWPRTGSGNYFNPAQLDNNPHADELIAYYEVRPYGGYGSAGILKFPPNEVIMIRKKSPLDKIDGYSPLAAVAQWIDTEESISKSRWAQFINMARPEFHVELGEGYNDPDDNQIARLESKFLYKIQGEANYGKPVITPPGAKITPLSFNPTEMAYFQCLDSETECLTSAGWKRYSELTVDTQIACYDPETKTLLYDKPSAIHIKPYCGEMHCWQGDRIDAMMTPNHRTYVSRPTTYLEGGEIVYKETAYRTSVRMSKCRVGAKVVNARVWGVKKVEELSARTTYEILTAAPAACDIPQTIEIKNFKGWRQRQEVDEYGISPEVWLRFLGYYLSEGSLYGVGGWSVTITQKKYLERFREGVEATPFKWREEKNRSNGCTNFTTSDKGLYHYLLANCGQGSLNKRIPDSIKSWPAQYLRILLDALVEGDGSVPLHQTKGRGKNSSTTTLIPKSRNSWRTQYYTSSKQLADDVMEIAIKCGLFAAVSFREDTREEYFGRKRYTVNISSRTEIMVSPSQRSKTQYTGDIWCVTVPTGLFVVRRNGKAHITGNSEEQVASMILSTFKVPKTAVGISESMTYGSILATLSQMCVYCLNPRLRMLGQSLTKHLASRWDEERPSWSNRSHGGSGSHRKVKLWFDDTVPADPTQVNADMQADMAGYALSPNEIRAIRGRKPWQNGGDDPMGQGPGGVMPIPLNTGDDLSDLAKLIAPMTKPGEEAGAKEEMAGEGLDWRGDETKPGVESEEEEQDNGPLELPSGEDGALEDTDIEEPNGPPSKSYKELNHDGEGPRAKAGFSGKREDSAGRTICYENGKRVSCSGTPSKKPGKKPAADKPTKKPTVQQTTDSIKTLIAEGKATPKALTQALMYHTVPELKKLQEQLGVSIKGNKAKEDRAKEIAKQAIAAAKKGEGKEATKPPVAKPENKLPTSQPKLNQTTYPDLKGTVSPEVKKSLGNLGIKGLDNPQAIANVLGVPANAESILTRTDSNGVVSINIEGPGYKMTRHMFKDDKGEVTIYNESIHITDTGTGLGTQILSNQVEQASNAGFKKIVAAAAGRPGSVWNGYYTWPRLGYDAAIPNDVKLPPGYAGAKNISDLLEKEGGAKWWKENGKEFDATFDLSPGSKSRKVLDAYNKAKKESKK